jgi:uncharacterized membrane protein YbaN (DUF454 family)
MKKILVAAGLLFFVLGIVGLVHPDFTYHKTEFFAAETLSCLSPFLFALFVSRSYFACSFLRSRVLADGGFGLVEGVVGRAD